MQDFVLITGNQHKADLLKKWLGKPVRHHKVDLDEVQSLDVREVVDHKVRQAYELLHEPVLVEDVSLTFEALGRLPGTLIRWFLEELGVDGLAKLAQRLEHQRAAASVMYAFYDGKTIWHFEGVMHGRISPEPRGNYGFGWNAIFIPDGTEKTYAEMPDEELRPFSHRVAAIDKLRAFLEIESASQKVCGASL